MRLHQHRQLGPARPADVDARTPAGVEPGGELAEGRAVGQPAAGVAVAPDGRARIAGADGVGAADVVADGDEHDHRPGDDAVEPLQNPSSSSGASGSIRTVRRRLESAKQTHPAPKMPGCHSGWAGGPAPIPGSTAPYAPPDPSQVPLQADPPLSRPRRVVVVPDGHRDGHRARLEARRGRRGGRCEGRSRPARPARRTTRRGRGRRRCRPRPEASSRPRCGHRAIARSTRSDATEADCGSRSRA